MCVIFSDVTTFGRGLESLLHLKCLYEISVLLEGQTKIIKKNCSKSWSSPAWIRHYLGFVWVSWIELHCFESLQLHFVISDISKNLKKVLNSRKESKKSQKTFGPNLLSLRMWEIFGPYFEILIRQFDNSKSQYDNSKSWNLKISESSSIMDLLFSSKCLRSTLF